MRFSNQYPLLFDRFFENDLFDWSSRYYSNTNTTSPTVTIKESDDDFEVEVAAPDFTKND
jgi:HSP20 family protein